MGGRSCGRGEKEKQKDKKDRDKVYSSEYFSSENKIKNPPPITLDGSSVAVVK